MSAIVDILSDNLEAWDGEEDSVREEHAELIEATRTCLESVDGNLIDAAPEMLACLRAADAAWQMSFVPPWVAEIRALLARLDAATPAE